MREKEEAKEKMARCEKEEKLRKESNKESEGKQRGRKRRKEDALRGAGGEGKNE